MLASTAVICCADFSSLARENVSPGLAVMSLAMSSSVMMRLPLSLMSEMAKISPSLTFAVRYIARLSGLMLTSVESTLKST